jgi:hypothetical protein
MLQANEKWTRARLAGGAMRVGALGTTQACQWSWSVSRTRPTGVRWTLT